LKKKIQGFAQTIAQKKLEPINREVLVEVLQDSYAGLTATNDLVKTNIEKLLLPTTFTICTAHQPNLFTGHLYFVYKILHAIKLANHLQTMHPNYQFVPIFYMGSEDADLEELGHVNINDRVLKWETAQKGAVGRMVIDDALLELVQNIEGEFSITEQGKSIVDVLRTCYTKGKTIQQATLAFVDFLFGKYGLVVLIADDKRLKQQMIPVFKEELLNATSHTMVTNTSAQLEQHYKGQAHSRPINLFYLKDAIRSRIEKTAQNDYVVIDTDIRFTEEALLQELELHPECFSPNVILRGLYQETILPNIAFIGGGGEIAYWLQLQQIFDYYKVPYPVLLLRNSFLVQTAKQQKEWNALGFTNQQLFEPTTLLEKNYVQNNSTKQLETSKEQAAVEKMYAALSMAATSIDKTLITHIQALKKKQLNKLLQLDKKLIRAEKRNFAETLSKLHKLKNSLFPNQSLQERYDNLIPYYALWGNDFIEVIYQASLATESKFAIVTID
jgi:bacillithiol synthase